MKYTKEGLVSALALNKPVAEKLEKELQEKVAALNKLIRAEEKTAEAKVDVGLVVSQLAPVSMWCSTLEILIDECKKLTEQSKKEVNELTDEQARIALTRARKYTAWDASEDHNTKLYVIKGKQTPIDLIGMFAKLDVSIDEFKKFFPSLTLSLALLANARLRKSDKVDNSSTIIANYKGDEVVRKNLLNGADPASRSTICKAIDNCMNAYMPSAKFKAFKADAEVFYLAATKISRKDMKDIKGGVGKQALNAFLNYAHEQLVGNGTVIYNVKYRTTEIKANEYDMLIEPEIKAEEPEAKLEKPKRERKPKPEKAVIAHEEGKVSFGEAFKGLF